MGRSDSDLDSDLRPRRLNLRVQVPRGSLSPVIFVFETVVVSGLYLRRLPDRGKEVSEWVSEAETK